MPGPSGFGDLAGFVGSAAARRWVTLPVGCPSAGVVADVGNSMDYFGFSPYGAFSFDGGVGVLAFLRDCFLD